LILPDVNVLVYAHREELREHAPMRAWLEQTVNAARARS
jgi:predicted nucleic acid-binding protein